MKNYEKLNAAVKQFEPMRHVRMETLSKVRNYMKNISSIGLACLFLGACTGGPVGWGGTHKVLHKDSDIITIQYDSLTESYGDILAIASTHCQQFSKKPVVSNVHEASSSMGLVKTYTFSCRDQ